MANATDRLNQLQQYVDYYTQHGLGGREWGSYGEQPTVAANWANGELDKQTAQQQQEDQNAMFKGMYAGNGQSQFGAPPAYVQPQNQQQQPNPYSARAMQLNGGGQNDGQNGGNTLADMFRNYNKGG